MLEYAVHTILNTGQIGQNSDAVFPQGLWHTILWEVGVLKRE